MTESNALCESFPHTEKLSATDKKHRWEEYHQESVRRTRVWAPYIEELTRAKVLQVTGETYKQEFFAGDQRGVWFVTPRKWVWWILHYHVGLDVAWTVIGERYNRHRTSVMYTTSTFDMQMRKGHWRDDASAIQEICDQLSQIGLPDFNVYDHLAE